MAQQDCRNGWGAIGVVLNSVSIAENIQQRRMANRAWNRSGLLAACVTSSLVCNSLAASLLHLLLSIALCLRFCPSSRHPSKHPSQAACRRDHGENSVAWNNQVQPPRAVSQDDDEDQVDPCPVEHIPHELRQALGFEVVACSAERTIGIVTRTRETVEIELNNQSGSGEESVSSEGKRSAEGECQQEEDGVDDECDEMGLLEAGGVADSERFGCFLSHCT